MVFTVITFCSGVLKGGPREGSRRRNPKHRDREQGTRFSRSQVSIRCYLAPAILRNPDFSGSEESPTIYPRKKGFHPILLSGSDSPPGNDPRAPRNHLKFLAKAPAAVFGLGVTLFPSAAPHRKIACSRGGWKEDAFFKRDFPQPTQGTSGCPLTVDTQNQTPGKKGRFWMDVTPNTGVNHLVQKLPHPNAVGARNPAPL